MKRQPCDVRSGYSIPRGTPTLEVFQSAQVQGPTKVLFPEENLGKYPDSERFSEGLHYSFSTDPCHEPGSLSHDKQSRFVPDLREASAFLLYSFWNFFDHLPARICLTIRGEGSEQRALILERNWRRTVPVEIFEVDQQWLNKKKDDCEYDLNYLVAHEGECDN